MILTINVRLDDKKGVCPECGGRSKFGGTVVWCNHSGWVRTTEYARILREIAANLDPWDGYDKFQTILDTNGNDVGRWKLAKGENE